MNAPSPVNTTAGSVRKLKTGRSAGKFQATITLGEGRGAPKTTKTFDTRKAALAWLAESKRDGLPYGNAAEQTVAQAVDAYLASKVLAPNTVEVFRALRAHVVSAPLGDVRLGKLKPSAQATFTAWLTRNGFSPSTTNLYAKKLATVLRFAAADGGLGFVPQAVLVEERRAEVESISEADVAALFDRADDGFAPVILLGAFCGLRASEAAAVTVGDVDWVTGTLTVSKAVDDRGRTVGTKTANSDRVVPVPGIVLDQLAAHRFRAKSEPLATNTEGGRITTPVFAKTFRATADAAGLDVTFHALRKFFATTMLAAKVNPKSVAAWLGDTVETMLRTYAQTRADDADAGRAAIAAAFARTAAA